MIISEKRFHFMWTYKKTVYLVFFIIFIKKLKRIICNRELQCVEKCK